MNCVRTLDKWIGAVLRVPRKQLPHTNSNSSHFPNLGALQKYEFQSWQYLHGYWEFWKLVYLFGGHLDWWRLSCPEMNGRNRRAHRTTPSMNGRHFPLHILGSGLEERGNHLRWQRQPGGPLRKMLDNRALYFTARPEPSKPPRCFLVW